MIFTKAEVEALRQGKPVDVGGHRYVLCGVCGGALKLTGWLRGWHVCA